ncbi:MAG: hypothetical protein RJA70_3590 [Pseudomonadota bacterium]|jgi:hypothetical protein
MSRVKLSQLKNPTVVPRRRFLYGVGGVALGVPLLDAFMPRSARAQAVVAPAFAVFQVEMNGVVQENGQETERFWPGATGAITSQSLAADPERSLSVLSEHAPRLTLVRGLDFAFDGSGCGHSGGGNQVLTGHRVSAMPTKNKSLALGESVDHRIARAIQPGQEPLGFYAGPKGGYISDHVSFRGDKDLAVAEGNPWLVYSKMVGGGGVMPNAATELRGKRSRSINDLVRGELMDLLGRPDLSSDDRARLDLHLTAVRDIERKMVGTLPQDRLDALQALDAEHKSDDSRFKVVELQNELMAFAIASGYTSVAWFQNGDGTDGAQYEINGQKTPSFHQVSHRIFSDGSMGDPIPDAVSLHQQIDRLRLGQFKKFLDTLAAYDTPEGNLLDTGFVVYTNQQATGSHSYKNVPYVIAGTARGFFPGGRFVDVGGKSNNLILNTLASAAGARNDAGNYVDDLGDPSLPKGLISELMA